MATAINAQNPDSLKLTLKNTISDSVRCNVLIKLTDVYYSRNELVKAEEYGDQLMKLSRQSKSIKNISNAADRLKKIHKALGNFDKALTYYKEYLLMHDSLLTIENHKAIIRTQFKHEYEKKAAQDSIAHAKEAEVKNAELALQKTEIKTKRNIQYVLYTGVLLVLVFSALMQKRFKITKKQRKVIEEQKTELEIQKNLVEEKQKEILDSIHYAKRIQRAQLPTEIYIKNHLAKLTG